MYKKKENILRKYIDLLICYIKTNFAAMEVYDKDFILALSLC